MMPKRKKKCCKRTHNLCLDWATYKHGNIWLGSPINLMSYLKVKLVENADPKQLPYTFFFYLYHFLFFTNLTPSHYSRLGPNPFMLPLPSTFSMYQGEKANYLIKCDFMAFEELGFNGLTLLFNGNSKKIYDCGLHAWNEYATLAQNIFLAGYQESQCKHGLLVFAQRAYHLM